MPLAWPCISSQFLLLPVFLFWEVSMIPATMHHSEGREYRVRSLQASSHNIAITQSICNLGLCFLLKHAACNTHCGSMNTELGNSTVAHAWRKLLYIVCQAHHGLPVIGIPRQHPSITHEGHCKQLSHQQKSTKIQGHCTKQTTKRLLAHSRSWTRKAECHPVPLQLEDMLVRWVTCLIALCTPTNDHKISGRLVSGLTDTGQQAAALHTPVKSEGQLSYGKPEGQWGLRFFPSLPFWDTIYTPKNLHLVSRQLYGVSLSLFLNSPFTEIWVLAKWGFHSSWLSSIHCLKQCLDTAVLVNCMHG